MRATVLLQPLYLRRAIGWMNDERAEIVVQAYREGAFQRGHEVNMPNKRAKADDLEAVAEEMFDLTNNPGRQAERELLYGRHASVSTGDIVEVEHPDDPEKVVAFLCLSAGWRQISKEVSA